MLLPELFQVPVYSVYLYMYINGVSGMGVTGSLMFHLEYISFQTLFWFSGEI